MRYGMYNEGNYNEGSYGRRMRDTGPYSRYNEGGSYSGGRGSGRYRGNSYGHYPIEMMEEMKEYYMNYNEGREQYGRGNYGGGEDEMVEATEAIMNNITEIVKELADSKNPQVMQIIQKKAREIGQM